MPRGRPKGSKVLYSVWRNSDDRLLILDGTMEQCCAVLGLRRDNFYRLVNSDKYGSRYTIRKISREESKREEES